MWGDSEEERRKAQFEKKRKDDDERRRKADQERIRTIEREREEKLRKKELQQKKQEQLEKRRQEGRKLVEEAHKSLYSGEAASVSTSPQLNRGGFGSGWSDTPPPKYTRVGSPPPGLKPYGNTEQEESASPQKKANTGSSKLNRGF